MHRILTLTFTALLGCFAVVLLTASQPVEADNSTTNQAEARAARNADFDARVDALLAMPAEQRRAELKQMDPDERRSLWMRLKRTQALRNGHEPAVRGAGLTPRPTSGQAKAPNKALGTIVYDDGVINTTFGGGAIIGNRFDTASGNPLLASGTVETVIGVVVQGPAFSSSSAGFVLLGPQTGGGGAFAIFSSFTNAAAGTTATVTFTGIGANYTGSSFFVLFGDFASIYVPAFGTGTNNGQGHHGVVGYTGGMGPNITSTFNFGGALNGLVRAGGNVLPVELMSFEVE